VKDTRVRMENLAVGDMQGKGQGKGVWSGCQGSSQTCRMGCVYCTCGGMGEMMRERIFFQ